MRGKLRGARLTRYPRLTRFARLTRWARLARDYRGNGANRADWEYLGGPVFFCQGRLGGEHASSPTLCALPYPLITR